MRKTHPSPGDSTLLYAVLFLVSVGGLGGVAAWYLGKPRPLDVVKAEPPPEPAKPKATPKPKPPAPKADPRPDPKAEPVPPGPRTFEDDWSGMVALAARLRAEGEARYADRRRVMKDEAALETDLLLKEKLSANSYMTAATAGELRGAGVAALADGLRAQVAAEEPTFRELAGYVWARSPARRSPEALAAMAVGWAGTDGPGRFAAADVLRKVEAGRRVDDFERDIAVSFAGADYWERRP